MLADKCLCKAGVKASLYLAVLAIFSAQAQAPSVQEAERDLLALEYADTQGCFIISGDAVRPVMPLLVASDGLDNIAHDHVIAALDAALARECDIDQPDLHGLSPLNTAIVQGNVELVRYLLSHGADPHIAIDSDREQIDGLDSEALLDVLSQRDPERQETWQAIREALIKKQ